MKAAAYIASLLGLALLIALFLHSNSHDILRVNALAGWRLLWLVPYRATYFLLFALGWYLLLRRYDSRRRAGFGYVFWLTGVREAIDRLLPVASVGGAFVAVRLMAWRGVDRIQVSASVIAEILLTLWASYLFAGIGFLLGMGIGHGSSDASHFWLVLLCTLPVPLVSMLLLRRGGMFSRLERVLGALVGVDAMSQSARNLDHEVRELVSRLGVMIGSGALQFAALVSASLEIWLAMRWFGHPVGITAALILEAATQAVRHLAFVVPAALGVQEAGLVVFGHLLGISPETALAISIAKRMREILCGIPYLVSWQWLEAQRIGYRQTPACTRD